MLTMEQIFLALATGAAIGLVLVLSAVIVRHLDKDYFNAILNTEDEQLGPKEADFVFFVRTSFMWVWALMLLVITFWQYAWFGFTRTLQVISFFFFLLMLSIFGGDGPFGDADSLQSPPPR